MAPRKRAGASPLPNIYEERSSPNSRKRPTARAHLRGNGEDAGLYAENFGVSANNRSSRHDGIAEPAEAAAV